jgi:hypothetical protein
VRSVASSPVRSAGVGEVVSARLPSGLQGAHGGTRGGNYVIYYLEDDWDGGREHTVFHETYEILQEKFADLCPDFKPRRKPAICRDADRSLTRLADTVSEATPG